MAMIDFSSTVSSLSSPGAGLTEADIADEGDVRLMLDDICRLYRFRGFMVLMLPDRDCSTLSEASLMTSWSDDEVKRYDEACLLHDSPVVHRLRTSTIPFSFETGRNARNEALAHLFKEIRHDRCLYLPVHDVQGNRGAVAFGGDRPNVSQQEIWELNLVAGVLFSRLRDFFVQRGKSRTGLSRRELECLQWAAAGKTTAEMARIMELSEYTVNHYLHRATRKLDSVNRVQTVAKALRAGLIN